MNVRILWIWITVSAFFGIEAGLLWVFWYQNDRNRAAILFGATIVAGAFALYSYLQRLQEERFKEAGKMMERWNSPDRVQIRKVMAELTDDQIDVESLRRKARGEKFSGETRDHRVAITSALNFYEELSIGIFERSIDEERCFRFFHSMADQTYSKLAIWIQNERDVDNAQTYYIEFQRLIERWRKRKI